MTALRIGDEPLTPAAVAAAARQRRIEVELTDAARERMAASHRHGRARGGRAPGLRPHDRRRARTATSRSTATCATHTSRLLRSHAGGLGDPLAAEIVRGTILVRLTQMAAGNGGHRLEVADALIGVLRDDALPELRDLGGLGHGRPHRARAARPRARRQRPAGDRAGRRAAADELERRDVRRRRRWPGPTSASCSTPGSASPRSPSTRSRATPRRSPPRSPRPGRCAGWSPSASRLRVLTAGARAPARHPGPVRPALPAAGRRRAVRVGRGRPQRARGRDQRRLGEPARRRRRDPAPRRLPRGDVRARARGPAARDAAVRRA